MNQHTKRAEQANTKTIDLREVLERAVHAHQSGEWDLAQSLYTQVLQKAPNQPDALHLYGVLALQRGDAAQAAAYIGRAITHAVNPVDMYANLGAAFYALGRVEEEHAAYETAHKLAPNDMKLLNELVKTQRLIANWTALDARIATLAKASEVALREGREPPLSPYHALTLPIDAELKKHIAESAARRMSHAITPFSPRAKTEKRRCRVGYVSADFRNHPTGHLLKNIFAHHDRTEFEIFAYMIGPCDESPWQKAIEQQVEHWIALDPRSTAQAIAARIYADEIDILLDVMGYIQNAKPQIFAYRPASIQINYLAYPGTLGAPHIPYLVSDAIAMPEDAGKEVSETVLRLPHSYFVMDGSEPLPPATSRAELGLPEEAFVYCAFNKTDKIDPDIYALWMEILQAVPHAVLWLYAPSSIAQHNFRAHAKHQGIEPSRLYFAHHLEKTAHLARLQAADLFLDCAWVSAHTTAIDMLYSGVPVLTLKGEALITRASESILTAANQREWIAQSREAYYKRAVAYAHNQNEQREVRAKLQLLRTQAPLFDAKKYVQHMEQMFQTILR